MGRWHEDPYTKIRRARAGGYVRRPRPERFQMDAQWQRDFGNWIKATQECERHRDAGDLEAARECLERAECLHHALKFMEDRPTDC